MRAVLRRVTKNDSDCLFVWRNMDRVRKFVFDQEEIKPDEHTKWFGKMLKSADQAYYIFEERNAARGVVGFSGLKSGIGHWGFYTTPEAPKGTGMKMLSQALDEAFQILSLRRLEAEVLEYNLASIRLHHKLGFHTMGKRCDHRLNNGSFHDVVLFAKNAPDLFEEQP